MVIILPRRNDPQPLTLVQKALALVLMIAAIATCLETAALVQNFDLFAAPARLPEVLPIGGGNSEYPGGA